MWSKYLPLVGGLCHAADFDQMWSKYLPLFGGLCLTADFDQMWSWILPHVEDLSCSGLRPNVVHKMPTIERVFFESEKPTQRKRYPTIWFRSRLLAGPKDQIGLCQSSPSSKKNDSNTFIMPRCKNDAVASTKMTPNNAAMCINVIRRSCMIYLRCLKIFCVRTLVFWSRFMRIAEFACRGLEQKQQWMRSEALSRASRTRLDREGSFLAQANEKKGEEWYSSYYVHISVTPYSELAHREFPYHRTPR